MFFFFFSSRRRHTSWPRDWSSDVCSSDLRRRSGEDWAIEVLPWIRLGPRGSAARLAHAVEFPIGKTAPTKLEIADYEKLRERIYFSVATELYRPIRTDVQKKIDFLPKRYFRAAAYFHE